MLEEVIGVVQSHGADTYTVWTDGNPLKVHVHAWDDDGHLAGAFEPQNVGLLQREHRRSERHRMSHNLTGSIIFVCVCVCVCVYTHIADGCEFLSCVALLQQSSRVLTGVGALVIHCELGPHQIRPAG